MEVILSDEVSGQKLTLIKSIYVWSLTNSPKIQAINVESSPPENKTAISGSPILLSSSFSLSKWP